MKLSAILARIRRCFRAKEYKISAHALEELASDDLDFEDLRSILLGGKIETRFTEDLRGARYEVAGLAIDGRKACVVCRFVSGVLQIITVYVADLDTIQ